MNDRWHVYLTGGQSIAWALDEDLHWVKRSLGESCKWTTLPTARIIHAAWPMAINVIPEGIALRKTVVCQADNPPSFYLGTDGFAQAAACVDLWIARTSEAYEQFRTLELPVVQAPYCIDSSIFFPLADKANLRARLGIAKDDFVIGNFHRDTEGADLTKPKRQKGPDIFFEIARGLAQRVPRLTVLLAGPRRHWLLNALEGAGVRVVFAGEKPDDSDDYKRNIQSRERLNELYQALDVCVISSRWEGGPYSVLESLAAGTPVISSPVGTSRDVLPSECLFGTVEEAVQILEHHAKNHYLDTHCKAAADRASKSHSKAALTDALLAIYESLPKGATPFGDKFASVCQLVTGRLFPQHKASMKAVAEMTRRVNERAASIKKIPALINYTHDQTLESLLDCAAKISAARQHENLEA